MSFCVSTENTSSTNLQCKLTYILLIKVVDVVDGTIAVVDPAIDSTKPTAEFLGVVR